MNNADSDRRAIAMILMILVPPIIAIEVGFRFARSVHASRQRAKAVDDIRWTRGKLRKGEYAGWDRVHVERNVRESMEKWDIRPEEVEL